MVTDYEYTPMSNRLTKVIAGFPSDDVGMDDNGNITFLPGKGSFNISADNRLTWTLKSPWTLYGHNGLGQRAYKLPSINAPLTGFVYSDDGLLLAETDWDGGVTKNYVYLNGELLTVVRHDIDEDGWSDGKDNCLTTANPEQLDGDADGFGNRCDGDLDNDGDADNDDLAIISATIGNANPDPYTEPADVNEDYAVDSADEAWFTANLAGQPEGPSGQITAQPAQIFYVHNDHLGTPHAVTDAGGTKVWSAVYDPFGKATVNEDVDGDGKPVVLNVRFPGQYYDAESGLHYNYFRTYDPETGRYVTSDPIGLEGGINTYAYVDGNPVTNIDRFGLCASSENSKICKNDVNPCDRESYIECAARLRKQRTECMESSVCNLGGKGAGLSCEKIKHPAAKLACKGLAEGMVKRLCEVRCRNVNDPTRYCVVESDRRCKNREG